MIPRLERILIAFSVGVTAFWLSLLLLLKRGMLAGDFTWLWRAGQVFLSGHNPYHNPEFALGNPYPFTNPLPYPLPAVLVTLPFTALPPYLAGALFWGIGSGLLAYGVTRDGRWRLPMFLSAPFVVGAGVAQWAPYLMAAAFLPCLPILAIKPNIALALTAHTRAWRAAVASVFIYLVSLPLLPSWPLDMLQNVSQHRHPIPLLVLPGPLLFLAVLRWRDAGARLLLLLAAIPQVIRFYDQIYLWLIPQTARQSWALTLASWVGYVSWFALHEGVPTAAIFGPADISGWVIGCTYLPAVALVLWQARASIRGVLHSRSAGA